jgi:predicted nucleic acid-binding protein
MKALIDSVVFIGAFVKRDQWHDAGTNLVSAISEGTIDVCITYFILAEVINYLQRKGGPIFALSAYHALTYQISSRLSLSQLLN